MVTQYVNDITSILTFMQRKGLKVLSEKVRNRIDSEDESKVEMELGGIKQKTVCGLFVQYSHTKVLFNISEYLVLCNIRFHFNSIFSHQFHYQIMGVLNVMTLSGIIFKKVFQAKIYEG